MGYLVIDLHYMFKELDCCILSAEACRFYLKPPFLFILSGNSAEVNKFFLWN